MTLRERLRGENGVTIVEVVWAAFILIVGLGLTLAALPVSGRQTQNAQREEVAAGIGQREIEAARRLSWSNLGLKAMPAPASNGLLPDDPDQDNPRNPDFYVTGGKLQIKDDFHKASSGALAGTPAAGEDLIVTGSNGLEHISTPITVDGVHATVYRYVTGRNETCAPQLPLGSGVAGSLRNRLVTDATGLLQGVLAIVNPILDTRLNPFCLGPGPDAKRVIVAVTLDRPSNKSGLTRPIYFTTLITDPARGLLN